MFFLFSLYWTLLETYLKQKNLHSKVDIKSYMYFKNLLETYFYKVKFEN
jgi:hypothetical protein